MAHGGALPGLICASSLMSYPTGPLISHDSSVTFSSHLSPFGFLVGSSLIPFAMFLWDHFLFILMPSLKGDLASTLPPFHKSHLLPEPLKLLCPFTNSLLRMSPPAPREARSAFLWCCAHTSGQAALADGEDIIIHAFDCLWTGAEPDYLEKCVHHIWQGLENMGG